MAAKSHSSIRVVLGLALIAQCVALVRIAYVDSTAIGTTMFMTFGWEESTMLLIDRMAAWTLFVLALTMLVRPQVASANLIALWFVLIAIATWFQGGDFGAAYAPFSYAARYGLPIVMVLFAFDRKKAMLIARILVAVTFFAHGVEALTLHPRFVDFIIAGFDNVLGVRIGQSAAETMLRVIGVMDCTVAILVVVKKWKWVVAWMAVWGLATASSRMIHLGFPRWPATLYRSAHFALPLALYLWWGSDSVSESKAETEEVKID